MVNMVVSCSICGWDQYGCGQYKADIYDFMHAFKNSKNTFIAATEIKFIFILHNIY